MPRKRLKQPVSQGSAAPQHAGTRDVDLATPWPAIRLAALGLAIAAALTIYYGDAPRQTVQRRLAALAFLAAPDELFVMWCGGKLANFSLLDRCPTGLLALTILGGAWLAGRLALRLLGVARACTRLERAVFALGVGLSLLSLYALAVGLLGGLQKRWLFAVSLGVLALANAWPDRRAAGAAPDVERGGEADDRRWRWALLGTLPFVFVVVLGAMLPPWDYDVREYHLQAPKEWFQKGRIDFLPHNIYANMPLGSELTALWGMALAFGDDRWWWGAMAGKTVMAAYSLVTAAALVAFGRRLHSLAAGVVAAIVFLSTPWIIALAVAGYNEGPVAMYALLAVFALWLAEQQTEEREAIKLTLLAGFCAGSAVACKYPPLLFLVVPLAVWVVARPFRRVGSAHHEQPADSVGTAHRAEARPVSLVSTAHPTPTTRTGLAPALRRALLAGGLFSLGAFAACGLWFAKNWVLTNNPTYPLLYSLFDGRTRTPEKDRQWTRVHSPQPDEYGRRFSPRSFVKEIAWNGWRTVWASMLIPPLATVAWLARPQRGVLASLACWAAFVFLAWWLATHRLDRFLVILLPAASLASGIGALAVDHPAWRRTALSFVAAGALVQFVFVTLHPDNRYFAPLARLRNDDRDMGLQGTRVNAAHRWLNQHAQRGERVLLVGDAEPFDLEIPAIYNTCFDDCQFTRLFKDRSRPERLELLRAEQIAYVFFSWNHLARYRSPGNYGYTSDYPTFELVHRELVEEQRLLIPIDTGGEPEAGELFRVAGR